MNRLWKTLPAFLTVFLLALAAACGGDGNDSSSSASDEPPGAASEPIVANAADVFGPSVEAFQEQVESGRAEFGMEMSFGDVHVDANGEMAFTEDGMYMSFVMNGGGLDLGDLGTFEMLALGDQFYMKMFGEWYVFDASEFSDAFGELDGDIEDQSIIDYESLVDAFGEQVEDFGEEELDGATFRHYRVSVDMIDLLDSVMDSVSDTTAFGLDDLDLQSSDFPMVMDVWVEPDSMLPHLMDVDASLEFEGETMEMSMSMRFFDYNEDVDLPDPPDDAQPFDDLFGDLFEFEASAQ